MTIKQIVLDVLGGNIDPREGYKVLFPEDIEEAAKSISAKIQAVSIDRRVLAVYLEENFGGRNWTYDTAYQYVDKILSLLKPVKTLGKEANKYRTYHINKKYKTLLDRLEMIEKLESRVKSIKYLDRGGVEKILKNNCRDFEWVILKEVSETPEQAFNRVIDAICNLVIKEGDK